MIMATYDERICHFDVGRQRNSCPISLKTAYLVLIKVFSWLVLLLSLNFHQMLYNYSLKIISPYNCSILLTNVPLLLNFFTITQFVTCGCS